MAQTVIDEFATTTDSTNASAALVESASSSTAISAVAPVGAFSVVLARGVLIDMAYELTVADALLVDGRYVAIAWDQGCADVATEVRVGEFFDGRRELSVMGDHLPFDDCMGDPDAWVTLVDVGDLGSTELIYRGPAGEPTTARRAASRRTFGELPERHLSASMVLQLGRAGGQLAVSPCAAPRLGGFEVDGGGVVLWPWVEAAPPGPCLDPVALAAAELTGVPAGLQVFGPPPRPEPPAVERTPLVEDSNSIPDLSADGFTRLRNVFGMTGEPVRRDEPVPTWYLQAETTSLAVNVTPGLWQFSDIAAQSAAGTPATPADAEQVARQLLVELDANPGTSPAAVTPEGPFQRVAIDNFIVIVAPDGRIAIASGPVRALPGAAAPPTGMQQNARALS